VLGTNPDGLIGAGPTLAADIQALKNEVGMLREQLLQQLPPPPQSKPVREGEST
jgi:hypothetical protein